MTVDVSRGLDDYDTDLTHLKKCSKNSPHHHHQALRRRITEEAFTNKNSNDDNNTTTNNKMATATIMRFARKRPLITLCATGWVGIVGTAVVVEANTHRRDYYHRKRRQDKIELAGNGSSSSNNSTMNITSLGEGILEDDEGGLPRHYDKKVIDKYWSARPVTVALRSFQVAYELGPRIVAGVWDFGIVPYVRGGGGGGGETPQHEKDEEAALRKHAQTFCEVLTNLGPAFVKMGQQLSIRPDLLPPIVLKELQTLCDAVRPITDEIAWQVLRQEWKVDDLSVVFDGDMKRVAAASLGQVYKARLRETGEEVAIKIQRPDMLESFSLDLYLLQWLGYMMDAFCVTFTKQPPFHQNLLDTFSRGSYSELDYELEAANQIHFHKELAHLRDKVVIPTVFQSYTTRRILVSQWIDGIRLIDASPDVIQKLIPVGLELFLTQLLDMGLFHADGHPGNLLVTNNGTALCLIDFGLCVRVDEQSRRAMTKAIWHLMRGDVDALLADDAKELGFLPQDFDTTELKPILTKILYTVQSSREDETPATNSSSTSTPKQNIQRNARKFMDISNELNQIFFQYPFSVPPFFALVTRGLSLLEGVALTGDPNFNILRASAPFARRRVAALWSESPSLIARLTSKRQSKPQ